MGIYLLTPEEAAARMDISAYTVRAYLRAGKIKGCQVAHKWRISEEALAEFIQTMTDQAQMPRPVGHRPGTPASQQRTAV